MTKSLARKKLEGRLIGGSYSDLANYSQLFARTHDGILLLDPAHFEILQANPACATLMGASSADLVGQDLPSFFDEFTRAKLAAFLKQTPVASLDLIWSSTRGRVQLELSVSKLELADYCTVLQLIVRDVTAVRERQTRLESLSSTDELTGLPNRRAYNEALATAHACGETYAVLLVDVDHFKHFNDRNGHAAGDIALQEVARHLAATAAQHPGTCFAARYGGEEFVLIVRRDEPSRTQVTALPSAPSLAASIAESVRAQIQASRTPHSEHQPLGFLSVSIGASNSEPGVAPEEIARRADAALYRSKETGRNRVTFHSTAADPSSSAAQPRGKK